MSASSKHLDDPSIEEMMMMVGRDPLTAAVQRALVFPCNVEHGGRIVLGFSGGADSTALLLLLQALLERPDSQPGHLVAVHVDHGIRPESVQESNQARALCERLGIEVEIRKVDLSEATGNLSDRARIARYRALAAAAEEHGCGYIATAHHAEDRFETMLHSLCRGTGASGLAQPRWTRALEQKQLIRPLLACSRADLRALCDRFSLAVIEDPTNADQSTSRGMLREQVLPLLEERWPGAAIRASSAADRLSAAALALEQVVSERFGPPTLDRWNRTEFHEVDHEVVVAVLRRAIVSKADGLAGISEENAFSLRLSDAAFAACDGLRHRRVFDFAQGRIQLQIDADFLWVRTLD